MFAVTPDIYSSSKNKGKNDFHIFLPLFILTYQSSLSRTAIVALHFIRESYDLADGFIPGTEIGVYLLLIRYRIGCDVVHFSPESRIE